MLNLLCATNNRLKQDFVIAAGLDTVGGNTGHSNKSKTGKGQRAWPPARKVVDAYLNRKFNKKMDGFLKERKQFQDQKRNRVFHKVQQ